MLEIQKVVQSGNRSENSRKDKIGEGIPQVNGPADAMWFSDKYIGVGFIDIKPTSMFLSTGLDFPESPFPFFCLVSLPRKSISYIQKYTIFPFPEP